MDLVNSCTEFIREKLEQLEEDPLNPLSSQDVNCDHDQLGPTQVLIRNTGIDNKDKNLVKILDQQTCIKTIMEKDERIKTTKALIAESRRAIEELRKNCSHIGLTAARDRQELIKAQAKDIERYQVQQLKSIADDYERHHKILQQRSKEIQDLKVEIENEEKNRAAFLASVETSLERELQNRQQQAER